MAKENKFSDIYKLGIASRKIFDLSREDVAKISGLTARTVRNIEGGRDVNNNTMKKYMYACGVGTVTVDFSKRG
jgi:DNA-binding XRE family transcriptional regulator